MKTTLWQITQWLDGRTTLFNLYDDWEEAVDALRFMVDSYPESAWHLGVYHA